MTPAPRPARLAAAVAALLLAGVGPALAQVTVYPDASSATPATQAPAKPAHKPPAKPAKVTRPTKPAAKPVVPAKPVTPTIAPPVVPPAPPPAPVVPPPLVVPTRPVPPPAPVSVMPDAPGEATAGHGTLRLTFGPQRADLNPATDAALRKLVHDSPAGDAATFAVTAYAAGNEDDPSTARRMSLARALAVRSVMITEGVPSIRIYVKALGAVPASGGDAPADRVDIAVTDARGTPTPGAAP